MVNKSALESADIPIKARLQAFGDKMAATSLINILQARYKSHSQQFIRRISEFEPRSYHGLNGRIIADSQMPNGDLTPTQGMTAANRRPAGICYVKIAVDITFTDLDSTDGQAYPFTYFVRLPMENRTVQNSTGNDVELNTFHGDADWARTLVQADLDLIWDNPKSLNKPFWLTPPTITDPSADAQIEFDKCIRRLETISLEAAWPFATAKVFSQTCPNFTDDPASVIQGIHQESTKDNEKITLSVEQYFKSIQTLTNFLPKTESWSIDVVQHFCNNVTPAVREQMQTQSYNYDASKGSKFPFDQIMNLQAAFAAATLAEKNLARVRNIAKNEMQASHAFHAQVNASRAEDTIKKYTNEVACWGCGGNHPWANKAGQLFCPKKDDPACQKKAAAARIDFVARAKKRNKEKSEKRKAQSAMTSLLDGVNADELKAFISSRSPEKKAKRQTGATNEFDDTICLTTLLCFPANMASKPLLPINIDTHLPHFDLAVGQRESTSIFKISLAFDTCAVTNVGWSNYHLAIAKKYPQIVKSLTWAKDKYTPLTLSGVVSPEDANKDDEKRHQTILPAVIEYHMPYLSKAGTATSFKIAIGPNVAVNTIIGMSMIKAGKLSLDVEDDLIDSGVLETNPFKVIYKPTVRAMPNTLNSNDENKTLLTDSDNHVSIETINACSSQAFTPSSESTTSE
jgi:hypothetical protein